MSIRNCICGLVAASCLWLPSADALAQGQERAVKILRNRPGEEPVRFRLIQRQEEPVRFRLIQRQAEDRSEISDYWLGLECYPIDAALRAHLELAEGQGLVVEQVVPESPGDKAGLKQHDVLVKADEETLKTVRDLVEIIRAAEDEEFTLHVIRAGKPITIKVTPAKRTMPMDPVRRVPDRDLGVLRRWMDSLEPGQQPRGPFKYRLFGPGVVLPGQEPQPLPKDMSVTIMRQGDEPAKITVKKGDKSWEVAENELEELPEDLRPHVERMLGRSGPFDVPRPGFVPPEPRGERPGDGPRFFEGRDNRAEKQMEKQFQQLNEQLERLRKEVQEMQKSLPKAPAPPEPAPNRA